MRITKSILLTALFALVLGTASANSNPDENSTRNEIKTLIQKANLMANVTDDVTINVTFTVNAKKEIIILSTDQQSFDSKLKSTLNYKKLKSTDININSTYTLPVTLKKH